MSERNLLVDVYAGDLGGKPNWSALLDAPDFVGAIVKATEGTSYGPDWFDENFQLIKETAAERYEQGSFVRGAYHFAKFNVDGAAQADFYLSRVERAGGFDSGDIVPIVDVELGSEGTKLANGQYSHRNSNWDASAQQIIDCISAWAERVKAVTGQQVMLYGVGAMREKGISDRMNCDWLWVPRYTATLPRATYENVGWSLDQLALWQYCGDGEGYLAGYPTAVDGFGKPDISVVTFDSFDDFRSKVCGQACRSEQQQPEGDVVL